MGVDAMIDPDDGSKADDFASALDAGWRRSRSASAESALKDAELRHVEAGASLNAGATMTRQRLPSLDGLRAISIGLVISSHAVKVAKAALGRLPRGLGLLEDWGMVGVTLFFVISGFLITKLLCDERKAQGTINLRAFYVRRALRILPAYWTYLIVIAAFGTSASALWASFLFLTDYFHADPWVLGHSWSLSVEEQFYLLWPILVLALAGARARRVAIALIVLVPVARILTYLLTPSLRPGITGMLHLRVDALMIGCWAALERARNPASKALSLLSRPGVAAVSMVTTVLVSPLLRHVAGDLVSVSICYSVEALGACSVLLWSIGHARSVPGRVLNSRVLSRIGVVSYSLYLWQQPWLNPEAGRPLWALPLLVLGAYGCAELSYRLVEKPMLALRPRMPAAPPSGTLETRLASG